MSWRTIAWIVAGVVAAHIAAFFVVGKWRALPKSPQIPPPNFGFKQTTYVDPKTGEKTVEQEFRVSTKLTPRGTEVEEVKSQK